MEINVEITRKDFIGFNKYYYLKKGLKKRLMIYLIVIIVLPLIMSIGRTFDLFDILIDMVMTAFIFGLIYFGLGYLSINLTGKLPSSNGSIIGKRKYIITNNGFVEESENNTNIQNWNSIKSIEQNREMIFIFVDKIAAYIIPKRYFKSQERVDEFIQKLNSEMNKTN